MPSPTIHRWLSRGLIAFWAIWFTIVFSTNVADAAKALEWLPANWPFASGNYRFLESKTARYGAAGWVNAALFAGVIAWEGSAAALFWRAYFGSRDAARLALVASLGLWAAFLIADEIVIAYDVTASHIHLFLATLATLFAIEYFSDRSSV